MRCVICGRVESHCKRCHFVHDHIELLDGTVASGNRLQFFPPPWKLGPTTEMKVRDAWAEYDLDDRTPVR